MSDQNTTNGECWKRAEMQGNLYAGRVRLLGEEMEKLDPAQTTKETIPVSDDDLVRWEMEADNANPRLGTFNWPLVVRALIAKIRSMQNV